MGTDAIDKILRDAGLKAEPSEEAHAMDGSPYEWRAGRFYIQRGPRWTIEDFSTDLECEGASLQSAAFALAHLMRERLSGLKNGLINPEMKVGE